MAISALEHPCPIRVLHVVKTSDGATWAAEQARELSRLGVELHVALPSPEGRSVGTWTEAGAKIHIADLDFPVRFPWRLRSLHRLARRLVEEVSPDIIHSHFVGTTLTLRGALGGRHPVPRIFQVPGPLHLEHGLYRAAEVSSAGDADYWVCSSRCIKSLYGRAGVAGDRLFVSYYGTSHSRFSSERTGSLRKGLGLRDDALVVGNINYMYSPKYYLGQRVGLKCHEDVIDALALARKENPRITGVLAGGPWNGALRYESKLRSRAAAAAGDGIRMPGYLSASEVKSAWADFDCAVHVPLSENCGGVVEPLLSGVPVIAGRVGGLTEVIMDDVTGKTVAPRRPPDLAGAILEVLSDLDRYRSRARAGQRLVEVMFDVRRTADEIYRIYRHLLDRAQPRPPEFDSRQFLEATEIPD